MSGDRHRDSAICHLATDLLTRIAACMRTGQPYVMRDVDGREITEAEGKTIVKSRYKIDQKQPRQRSRTAACANAASKRRTGSHRSRKALQHSAAHPLRRATHGAGPPTAGLVHFSTPRPSPVEHAPILWMNACPSWGWTGPIRGRAVDRICASRTPCARRRATA